jgi:hypothetical protein
MAQTSLPCFPGATVAQVALRAGAHMGLKRVVLIGQDLALKDGALYGSSDPDRASGRETIQNTFTVPGYYGGEVETTPTLALFLRSFATLIEELSGRVEILNATEGGAAIPGAQPRSLASVLEELSDSPMDIQGALERAHRAAPRGDRAALQVGLARTRDQLDTLIACCESSPSPEALARAVDPLKGLLDAHLIALSAEELAPLYQSATAPDPQRVHEASCRATLQAALAAQGSLEEHLREESSPRLP